MGSIPTRLTTDHLLATVDDLSRIICDETSHQPANLLLIRRLEVERRRLMKYAARRLRREESGSSGANE